MEYETFLIIQTTVTSMLLYITKPWIGAVGYWKARTHAANSIEFYTEEYLWFTHNQFFHKKNPYPDDRCWFPQKIPKNQCYCEGYWIWKFGVKVLDAAQNIVTKDLRFQMSHVVKFLYHRVHIYQKNADGQYKYYPNIDRRCIDMSHLCHNSECLNPNHLVIEPHTINRHRNKCKNRGSCVGHFLPQPYSMQLPNCIVPRHPPFKMHDNKIKPPNYRHRKTKRIYTMDEMNIKVVGRQRLAYQREYQKKYYYNNHAAVREYQREYRKRNKEQIATYQHEYYERNKERIAQQKREYYQRRKLE